MQHPPASNRFGLPPRPADPSDPPPELAASASRIDLIILVFALGVWLGAKIGGAA